MRCEEVYFETYKRAPEGGLLSALTGFRRSARTLTISTERSTDWRSIKGIHIAYSRKENGVVELQSLNFPQARSVPCEQHP